MLSDIDRKNSLVLLPKIARQKYNQRPTYIRPRKNLSPEQVGNISYIDNYRAHLEGGLEKKSEEHNLHQGHLLKRENSQRKVKQFKCLEK